MNITGSLLIDGEEVQSTGKNIFAVNPITNKDIDLGFPSAECEHVDLAAQSAWKSYNDYRNVSSPSRAKFLRAIADEIMELGDTLVHKAVEESGLLQGRIEGERMRTCDQLMHFADHIEQEKWQSTRVDSLLPERTPPRSDLRYQKIPLGPVAVFGASNFPLAFSVAGGDTASALASGCPVVVKAHSAHPGTSWLVGKAIQKAISSTGMPKGVFSLLFGFGNDIGTKLVQHPLIKAVGFTGSRSGGLALLNVANSRPEPIPVYAEMSSINPLFVFADSLDKNTDSIAQGFAVSLSMGAGQFCTNPGVLVYSKGPSSDQFFEELNKAVRATPAQTMLTPGIKSAYDNGVTNLSNNSDLSLVSQGIESTGPNQCQTKIYKTSAEQFINNDPMKGEVFGACCVVVECDSESQFVDIAESLEGQLTCTIHCTSLDYDQAKSLVPVLERKAGRLIFNGYPTGVEVCHAMVHGGPFPATSNSMTSSVGSSAIERFLRPVCYQDFPAELLPNGMKDGSKSIVLIDGAYV
jgi:alpha-ketoglutaric semialdehyde dehydrogenase